MSEPKAEHPLQTSQVFHLPPLVVHPFNSPVEFGHPEVIAGEDDPALALVSSRYAELRMLCFIGKDLKRWIDHCLDFLSHRPEAAAREMTEADIIHLLLIDTPVRVRSKLLLWQIRNSESLFTRALGLNRIFSHAPVPEALSMHFMEHYPEYADLLYRFRVSSQPPRVPTTERFDFDLYASNEYIAIFEDNWNAPSNVDFPSDM